MMPLSSKYLDAASAFRQEEVAKKQTAMANKNSNGEDMAAFQAEVSYLLMSHSTSSNADYDFQRTGRWTDEETALADYLIEAFDGGKLLVEHGLKLNEFLADILLCKSSRLTKKMKNAKLSARSYKYESPMPKLDVATLATIEQSFVESITNDVAKCEMKFNLARFWRARIANLCFQIGNTIVESEDWMSSVEKLEARAVEAEENLRKARRRRIGMSTEAMRRRSSEVSLPAMKKMKAENAPSGGVTTTNAVPLKNADISPLLGPFPDHPEHDVGDFDIGIMDIGEAKMHPGEDEHDGDDYSKILEDLASEGSGSHQDEAPPTVPAERNYGSFLEEICLYMERNHLPFQHADVWVPSEHQDGVQPRVKLLSAGSATRRDLNPNVAKKLGEFGQYSSTFSFLEGIGVPGRVFVSGKPAWERHVDHPDSKVFKRANGAKALGVQTALGIPIATKTLGYIVVVFYSINDVALHEELVSRCTADLPGFCPEPKWKLVVEAKKRTPGVEDSASVAPPAPKSNPLNGDVDREIAAMLGEHMPLTDDGSPGLVTQFMSLRLLLLRSETRRSDQDNDFLDLIRQSYQGYKANKKREQKDIALLVVKEWELLRSTAGGCGTSVCSGAASVHSHGTGGASAHSHAASAPHMMQHPGHAMAPMHYGAPLKAPMMGTQVQFYGSRPNNDGDDQSCGVVSTGAVSM